MSIDTKYLEGVLHKNPLFKNSNIAGINKVKGDASGRSYHRILLNAAPMESVILMQLVGGKGPNAGGDTSLNEDQCFVNIQKFYENNGIRVPKIFCNNISEKFLIVEDAGDRELSKYCVELNKKISTEFPQFEDPRKEFFRQSLVILKNLQTVPKDESCIAFRRYLEFEHYRSDASSIIQNYLEPLNASSSHREYTQEIINSLCETIITHPTALTHRDYMAWNLEINRNGEVVLLDFQDSLIASQEFDIVCLLHDRDVDFQLGQEFLAEVVLQYKNDFKRDEGFKNRYLEILLYRYIRLAGHFNLLTKRTGNPVYANWVPGCLRRVGQALASYGEFTDLIDILGKYSKEIKKGADEGLRVF